MRTEYIDVTEISRETSGAYIHKIASASNPCLVFMPNLDYTGMYEAEQLAASMGIGFLNIPITLSVMDLVKQMEFAGVKLTKKLVEDIPVAIRIAILESLNGGICDDEC